MSAAAEGGRGGREGREVVRAAGAWSPLCPPGWVRGSVAPLRGCVGMATQTLRGAEGGCGGGA